ncbi:MAG: metallophosphatase domain-containing protein [Muribaculaceae bacterium]|nr:metallophosphatase domain-containing protein [Muribaculaceae bacterium]
MKILHISDTHGAHRRMGELPEVDVLIHSGDFTMTGSEAEAIDFLNWFCDLPHKNKIFICGNHDECLYGANIDGLDNNVHYLNNSGIEIDGIKFYGIPLFMGDSMFGKQNLFYEKIPGDTNVLITHCPPYGILDFDDGRNWGSEELLTAVSNLSPQAHLFGHIHKSHGIERNGSTLYSNAAIMNEDYTTLQSPNLIEI